MRARLVAGGIAVTRRSAPARGRARAARGSSKRPSLRGRGVLLRRKWEAPSEDPSEPQRTELHEQSESKRQRCLGEARDAAFSTLLVSTSGRWALRLARGAIQRGFAGEAGVSRELPLSLERLYPQATAPRRSARRGRRVPWLVLSRGSDTVADRPAVGRWFVSRRESAGVRSVIQSCQSSEQSSPRDGGGPGRPPPQLRINRRQLSSGPSPAARRSGPTGRRRP